MELQLECKGLINTLFYMHVLCKCTIMSLITPSIEVRTSATVSTSSTLRVMVNALDSPSAICTPLCHSIYEQPTSPTHKTLPHCMPSVKWTHVHGKEYECSACLETCNRTSGGALSIAAEYSVIGAASSQFLL